MLNYRKIWEDVNGEIPNNHEIHHIDGDRCNNSIENLICVSIEEHYKIHLSQGDYMACSIIATRMGMSYDDRLAIHRLAMKKRDQSGSKNPMYGKSTSKTVKAYWDSMTTEERKERIHKHSSFWNYDKTGSNNPMFGRSAVKEKNLKWYTNGKIAIYVTEGTQPEGYTRGRGKLKK